ncbi:Hypothetical protein R9X50_00680900 [Acrodontium crateriforme]|uniref:Uncharacterized protein n=1 Tax=Acrodontium crateriforme TaxID=150365 RepID=A0AAQ3MCA1_9PEZI|nr:Hypothetical protein R9X50_00680900 [Acrodontium crateriforme]
MNTIRSVGYGWGVLIIAGAGSYYFAKRSVNADRAERAAAEETRRQQREAMKRRAREYAESGDATANLSQSTKTKAQKNVSESHPVQSAAVPDSPYEAQEPFRSRKGDRFS